MRRRCGIAGVGIEPCQRLFDALAAFAKQRQLHPDGTGGGGQRDASLRVAIRRECPVETGAHIVDMAAIDGKPFGLRRQFALGFGVA